MAFTPDYSIINGHRLRRLLLAGPYNWFPARYVTAPREFIRMKKGDVEFLIPLNDAHEQYVALTQTAVAMLAAAWGRTVESVYNQIVVL